MIDFGETAAGTVFLFAPPHGDIGFQSAVDCTTSRVSCVSGAVVERRHLKTARLVISNQLQVLMHQNPHQLFSQGTCLPLSNTESQLPWFTKTTNLGDTLMKSSVIKRSIMIDGHKTSVSLEDAFWRGLKEIARGQQATLSNVVAEIDKARQRGNLSSAIRLFVLDRVRAPATSGPAMLSSRETEKAASPDGLLQPQI